MATANCLISALRLTGITLNNHRLILVVNDSDKQVNVAVVRRISHGVRPVLRRDGISSGHDQRVDIVGTVISNLGEKLPNPVL